MRTVCFALALAGAVFAAACSDDTDRKRSNDPDPCEEVADTVCSDACACSESACGVEYTPNAAYGADTYDDCYSYFRALYCDSTEPPWDDIDPDECTMTPISCGALGAVLPPECGGG
jgi:hypothetical protein